MLQLIAFCRSLRCSLVVALALCSAAIVASVSPASARSHHGIAASRARASRRPSCQAALRVSPSSLSAPRARLALGCRRRANEGARPCRRQCQPSVEHLSGGTAHVGRIWFVERGRRSAPLPRRQPDRPRQPVVRALHEHGAAARRSSRHRLGHGELVRTATASVSPDRRSAPSR